LSNDEQTVFIFTVCISRIILKDTFERVLSMTNQFLKVMLLLIGISAVNTHAANFKLIGSLSSLNYEIIKFKTITVEGDLADESKKTLTGNLVTNDLDNISDLKGSITLSNPYFKSGSYQRDIKLKEVIQGPIKIEIKQVMTYTPFESDIELSIKLSINGISGVETTNAQLLKEKGFITAKGELQLNRKKYALVFKEGFFGQLDLAIEDTFLLTYDLKFKSDL